MKRVLFFPNYFGSGFGHIGRSLLLAEELTKRGWVVAMVIAGRYAPAVSNKGYQVFRPWFPTRPRSSGTVLPAYTYIVDGNIQLIRDGFLRPWQFYAAVTEAIHIAKKFCPDVLIGDFSLVTWVVGRRLGLPVVQIAQSISYPIEPTIIWWEEPPKGAVSPDIKPVVNPILARWKLEEVGRVEDLLGGELYLIPNIPELEPVKGDRLNTYYTGAFISDACRSTEQQKSERRGADVPLVYVTLGGGASPFVNVRFYEMINQAFGNAPLRVIVSTGGKFDPSTLSSIPHNITYHQWVDGVATIRQTDMVLFHGGHGTMMETVCCGVPSLVLPFHSEQEGNGRRLEAQSAALVLRPTKDEEPGYLVRSRWKYGEFTTWVQPFSFPSPEILRRVVMTMLKDRRYCEGAAVLSSINAGYGGASGAVDIINCLI